MKVLLVTNMYPTAKDPAFGTYVYDQVQSLRSLGVDIDVLLINGRKRTLNYVWGVFRFWGVLLTKRYHLIHAHYAMSGLIARLQWCLSLVVTYHGAEVKDYVPRWLSYMARRGHRIFDQVIVVSQREKDLMVGDTHNVHVIPGGIDFDLFRPMPQAEARHALDLPTAVPLVLWAGEYWQPVKRFALVEAAMKLVQQRCPEAQLVLVSGKPHETIPLYMNACDVLVLTSFEEGSPTVIKEAMACNLPVVSTDVGDVAEVIQGTPGCYLVEANKRDIADKLYTVLQDRQRTHGRENIQYLDKEHIARRILAIYEQLYPSYQQNQAPSL